jgi:hypothetical protein
MKIEMNGYREGIIYEHEHEVCIIISGDMADVDAVKKLLMKFKPVEGWSWK